MEGELVVTFELLGDLLFESGLCVEPRDFVFILVREQLEVVARNRRTQRFFAGEFLRFKVGHALHQCCVTLGVGRILVASEKCLAPIDHLIDRFRELVVAALQRRWERGFSDRRKIHRCATAPFERLLVLFHRRSVELDGAVDRVRRDRDQALLVGVAHHKRIGEDRVAHQCCRDASRIDKFHRGHRLPECRL